jgi:hypothetical protein
MERDALNRAIRLPAGTVQSLLASRVATKVVAKSANVLSRIASTNSGDLARTGAGPVPVSGEGNKTCIMAVRL